MMRARSRVTTGEKSSDVVSSPKSPVVGPTNNNKRQRPTQKRFGYVIFCILAIVAIIAVARQASPIVKDTLSYPRLVRQGSSLAGTTEEKKDYKPIVTEDLEEEVDPISKLTLDELQKLVDDQEKEVRDVKSQKGIIMETDPVGTQLTAELQVLTQELIVKRYKSTKFRIQVDLEFPSAITEKDGLPSTDSFLIELAPIDLVPVSVYYFLELVRDFKSGSFIRNANHVLQAKTPTKMVGGKKPMPFQEYSADFPHKQYTTGFAGRPSGPQWYISIKDNTIAHGPGSQQNVNPYEADSLFGSVVDGPQLSVIPRIHSTPQTSWLDELNQIIITQMTILIPSDDGSDKWIPWTP